MMDTKDSFIFRQRNFTAKSFRTFEDMRRNEELTDFKITFQNRCFLGHRVILGATIPFFRTAFNHSDSEVTLMNEIDPDSLESVLEFAYSGKIAITCENVQSLLFVSEFLQLTQVHDACWKFMEKRMSVSNVWKFRNLAENQLRMETIGLADDYIGQHFEAFCKSESFLSLPFLYLKEVLSRDDLKVSTEECVYEAVIRWAKDFPSERRNLLPGLLSVVRLCHLSPVYLAEVVCREEIVRTSICCRDLIDEANRYYLKPEERSKILSSLSRPRMYDRSYKVRSCEGRIDNFGVYAVSSDGFSFSLMSLDFENAKWVNISTFRPISCLAHVIAFREKLYIFSSKAFVTFDMKTQEWGLLDVTDQDTWESGIVLHNNRVYIFGGGDSLSLDYVRCFDPQQNKWLSMEKMRRPLTDMGVASLAECIYITGGWSGREECKTVERYNPATKKWRKVSPMLSGRACHACASLKGKVYVCGGRTFSRSGEVYDPLTNQWNRFPRMTNLLSDITLVSHNEKLYALERRNHSSNPSVNLEIYDPEQNKWELCATRIEHSVWQMILVQW